MPPSNKQRLLERMDRDAEVTIVPSVIPARRVYQTKELSLFSYTADDGVDSDDVEIARRAAPVMEDGRQQPSQILAMVLIARDDDCELRSSSFNCCRRHRCHHCWFT